MIIRMRYLFTHIETGKTYLTKYYYEDGREAMRNELDQFDFPGGEFSWKEIGNDEVIP